MKTGDLVRVKSGWQHAGIEGVVVKTADMSDFVLVREQGDEENWRLSFSMGILECFSTEHKEGRFRLDSTGG
jgi:hypothetical protein